MDHKISKSGADRADRKKARSHFVASSGNVTDEVIAEYIRSQDLETGKEDNFEISKL